MWRWLLFVGAAVGATASTQPWTCVRFTRLFGEQLGQPAWQSSAGFTCLCTCALVAVLALAETTTRSSQVAVRPASMLLVTVMASFLLVHLSQGPGTVRGVTATWTWNYYLGLAGALTVTGATTVRFLATRKRRRTPPWVLPDGQA